MQIPGRNFGRACAKFTIWLLEPGRNPIQSRPSSPRPTPALEEAGPEWPGGLLVSTEAIIQGSSCKISL